MKTMSKPLQKLFILILLVILTACATGPRYDTARYDQRLTPQQSKADIENTKDSFVLWGGVIISSTNLEDATQLEILSYPLNSSQQPDTTQTPRDRFLIIKKEYLETIDYAQGRLITVAGVLTGSRAGQVGESTYIYPVVKADHLYLWGKNSSTDTKVHFGLGVILSN